MAYFVYILQSEKDGSFYIGSSEYPLTRLEKGIGLHSGYAEFKKLKIKTWDIGALLDDRQPLQG